MDRRAVRELTERVSKRILMVAFSTVKPEVEGGRASEEAGSRWQGILVKERRPVRVMKLEREDPHKILRMMDRDVTLSCTGCDLAKSISHSEEIDRVYSSLQVGIG